MSGNKKRILVMHETDRFLDDLKSIAGRSANLITAADLITAEAAIKIYKHIDVCIAEKTTPSISSLQFLSTARERLPNAARILVTESDAILNAYQYIQNGVVQKYYVKPVIHAQLREALGIQLEESKGSHAELAAILKRVNIHPPLTGGRSASSSPSLK